MATKIFDAYDLSSGSGYSSELTDVGDLVLDCETSVAIGNGDSITFEVHAHEGSNSYKPVSDGEGSAIKYSYGGTGRRINIKGVDSEFVKVYVNVGNGLTGTLTVETTKSENPNV